MSQAFVQGGTVTPLSWGVSPSPQAGFQEAPRQHRPRAGNAWLSAEEVAHLLLSGECLDAGVSVPSRFAPQAVESAINSVQRWTREGRIFAIHDLYPRYQFDNRGRPHPAVEQALSLLGALDSLRVGNWFAAPNPRLGGRRPQEMLASAPGEVSRALQPAPAPLPVR